MKVVVTGGAGFIGSSFIRQALSQNWIEHVINVDKLSYAGNLDNLALVEKHPGYQFAEIDICDQARIADLFVSEKPDAVVHLSLIHI